MSDPTPASPADDSSSAEGAPPPPRTPAAGPAPSAGPVPPVPPAPQPYPTAPGSPSSATPPPYPPPPQAYPSSPQAYPSPQGYGGPAGYAPPIPPQPRTNGMAVAALVCGIGGLVFSWTLVLGLASIAAVILGHISLKRLKTSGEAGYGMALAGTITGWVGVGLLVLLFVLFVIMPFLFFVGVMGAATTYSAA